MTTFTFITGVSRGIGQGVARSLSASRPLILTARSKASAQSLAGPRDLAFALDVSKPETFRALTSELGDARISCVVHNAAIYERTSSREAAEKTIDTNVFGPMRLNAALEPFLTDDVRVVLVSSGMGALHGYGSAMKRRLESVKTTAEVEAIANEYLHASARGAHPSASADATQQAGFARDPYSVSKALVNALALAWAAEHPKWSVVAASPGWVQTDMGGAGAPRTLAQGVARIVEATTARVKSGAFYEDSDRF